jgi:hypothetical protein
MKYKIETSEMDKNIFDLILSDASNIDKIKNYYDEEDNLIATVRIIDRGEFSTKRLGRPKKDYTSLLDRIKNLKEEGFLDKEIPDALNISKASYSRIKKLEI